MKQHKQWRFGRGLAAAALGCAIGLASAVHASAATPSFENLPNRPTTCRSVAVPTTIPSGPVTMHGELCKPLGIPVQTLQVLMHGGTYNSSYWDFPGFDGTYSYVHVANAVGYATLAIDRLGYGQSTRPLSQDDTFDNEVDTAHAVVQAARSGALGIHVRKVEGIGHSLGSGTVVGEAAKYPHDFDAIILTGYGQTVSPNVAKLNALYMEPANYLSRFATLDAGYKTHKPDTRGLSGLYYTPLADPAVIAADQATEDTVTGTEITSRPQGGGVQTTALTVPVLLADGQEDEHYCLDNAIGQPPHIGPACATAQAFWNNSSVNYPNACFSTALLQSGHDINLHVTARQSYAVLLAWSWATIPPSGAFVHCSVRGPLPIHSTSCITRADCLQ